MQPSALLQNGPTSCWWMCVQPLLLLAGPCSRADTLPSPQGESCPFPPSALAQPGGPRAACAVGEAEPVSWNTQSPTGTARAVSPDDLHLNKPTATDTIFFSEKWLCYLISLSQDKLYNITSPSAVPINCQVHLTSYSWKICRMTKSRQMQFQFLATKHTYTTPSCKTIHKTMN